MNPKRSPASGGKKARRAASLLGGTYHCLEERDLLIFYHERPLGSASRLLRTVRPRIVLTHSPADYMLDHEMTSTLARAAVFGAPVPNFLAGASHPPALAHIPHLYYCDSIEGKDALGRPVEPAFRIDVSGVIEAKAAMLAAHASQRDWLLKHHGMDHYLQAMRDWGAQRGRQAGRRLRRGLSPAPGPQLSARQFARPNPGCLLNLVGPASHRSVFSGGTGVSPVRPQLASVLCRPRFDMPARMARRASMGSLRTSGREAAIFGSRGGVWLGSRFRAGEAARS